MKNFYIFLTFDIDQDFAPNTKDYYNRNNAKFEGFKKGLPLIISKLKDLPFSTFVRADSQIYDIYGSYDYLLKKYPSVVKQLIKNNGEFNWHIHLYEKKSQNWIQIKENAKLVSAFIKDYNQVKDIELINHKVVRIGECTMSDGLMKTMDELGIKIDSTALPRRYRDDSEKHFDWSMTTNSIYSPSLEDYRIKGKKALDIKEVPMTTSYMQAGYDDQPYME